MSKRPAYLYELYFVDSSQKLRVWHREAKRAQFSSGRLVPILLIHALSHLVGLFNTLEKKEACKWTVSNISPGVDCLANDITISAGQAIEK